MKFDLTQQVTAVLAVVFIAYFTAHTVHLHNQASKQQPAQVVPVLQPDKPPDEKKTGTEPPPHRVSGQLHRPEQHPAPTPLSGFTDGQRVVLIDKLKRYKGNTVRLVQVGGDAQTNVTFAQLDHIFEQAGWNRDEVQIGQVAVVGVNFPSHPYMTGENMSSQLLSNVFSDFAAVGIDLPIVPNAFAGPVSTGQMPEIVIVVH